MGELTRKEWLEKRRSYIGGSDAAAALGVSSFRSKFELYQDKLGLLPDEPTEAMIRGTVLEPLVVMLYERSVGYKVKPSKWLVSKTHDFMAATPDRIDAKINSLIQGKTSSTFIRHKWGPDGSSIIPRDYRIQGQHEMAVTGAKRNLFVVLFADTETFRALVHMVNAGMKLETIAEFVEEQAEDDHSGVEFATFPLDRDPELIAKIIEGERKFWEDHVKKEVPPDNEATPEKKKDIIDATAEEATAMEKMRDASLVKKKAEQIYEEAKDPLKKAIGENSGIKAEGVGKVTYKAPGRKSIIMWKAVAADLKRIDPKAYEASVKENTALEPQKPRVMRPYFKKQ